MRRTLAAVASLSVALTLGLAPESAAGDPKADSTVTITEAESVSGGTRIRGKVKSPRPACRKNRTVEVYHDVPPRGPSQKDFLLGTVKTNKRGKWRLTTSFAPDKVYARVNGNNRCKQDTSGTVTVDN